MNRTRPNKRDSHRLTRPFQKPETPTIQRGSVRSVHDETLVSEKGRVGGVDGEEIIEVLGHVRVVWEGAMFARQITDCTSRPGRGVTNVAIVRGARLIEVEEGTDVRAVPIRRDGSFMDTVFCSRKISSCSLKISHFQGQKE